MKVASMRFKKLSNAINYIYWKKEATYEKVDFKRFNEIADRLAVEGKKIEKTTKREAYTDHCYSIGYKANNKSIYLYENGKYFVYYTNYIDDEKNKRESSPGQDGITKVSNKFKKDNEVSFKVAFGYVEEEYKRCIPKIFSYSRPSVYGKIIKTSSVDFSSHWPFNIQGRLPDSHTAVRYEGTVKPTEEYPFAFYLNSGHVAEYNRFDTHTWVKHEFVDAMFRYGKDKFPHNILLEPEKDVTVLMKPSKYELGKYYKEFYDMRNTYKDAKLEANASIGFMHTKEYKRYKMAHIVAIALGRAQQATIDAMDLVGTMFVVHAVVDGFIYKLPLKIGQDEKEFGALHQEWVGKLTMINATNQYIVMDDNGTCIKVKHGGYECYADGTEITEETVKNFKDFEKWVAKRGVE